MQLAGRLLAGCVAGLVLLTSPGITLAEAPKRVVSMNLCTDQLAMMLAAPGQLISVSRIAADPLTSVMWQEAAQYPTNAGGAEQIFLMDPDLVVAGTFSDPVAISMLEGLGVPVLRFGLVRSLDEVAVRLREMGEALGRVAEAEALIARFDADLALLRDRDKASGARGAFYYPNGYTLGDGTLSHEILTAAGLTNVAVELGRSGGGRLALEHLVLADPDLIIRSDAYPGASRSEEILVHPGLLSIPARAHVSGPDWVCGTPHVLRAIAKLQEAAE